jgi:hypothetical protein
MGLDHIALTDKERAELEKNLAEYEQRCEQERAREAEYAARPFKENNWIAELYQEFEKRNLEYIAECHRTIGVMIRLRERFPDNDRIQQWARYFIGVEQAEIENLMEDIKNGRETAREFGKLRRR